MSEATASNLKCEYPLCGEIWMCNLAEKSGSIQCGYRPVLILSNNKNNLHSQILNVIPITSNLHKRKLPVHVELLDYQRYGLQKPSVLLVEQIMTISKYALDYRIGKISDKKTIHSICRAIGIQIPIIQLACVD